MTSFLKNFWPGMVWFLVILVLTLLPGNYFPKVQHFWQLFKPDKLIHLSIFAIFAFLLMLGAFRQYSLSGNRYHTRVYPVLVSLGTGILTEMLQASLPLGREASIYDGIANFTGTFAGYLLFRLAENNYLKKNFGN
ncbi:MAG: VanZ family protein [Bacteroidales bacterium]|jgi:VanZ family protein|nr:VanZ family protein [Bacteroidales bacterium]